MATITRLRVTRAQEAWIQRQGKARLIALRDGEHLHSSPSTFFSEKRAVQGLLEEIGFQRELRRIGRAARLEREAKP